MSCSASAVDQPPSANRTAGVETRRLVATRAPRPQANQDQFAHTGVAGWPRRDPRRSRQAAVRARVGFGWATRWLSVGRSRPACEVGAGVVVATAQAAGIAAGQLPQ